MDVRVTVEAHSGRVLSAARLAGVTYGGPGYDGYEVFARAPRGYDRPPVPPADVPNAGAGRRTGPRPGEDREAAGAPPLPRARPGDVVVTGSVPEQKQESKSQPEASAFPPPAGFGDTAAETPKRPQQPAMTPIAPLE
jgi:hypothetical protein